MVLVRTMKRTMKRIIMDWFMLDDNVNLLVEFDVMSMSIRFPKDNYYTITQSMYVKLDDAVDCFIRWWLLVWMTSTIRDNVTSLLVSGAINNVLSNGDHTNDNNTSTLSSSLLAAAAITAVVVAFPLVRNTYSD